MNMKKAALINAAGKYSKIILSVIINAFLARILSSDDYGVVAVITVFSTFFTTFSDMGFGSAIIQKKNLTEDDINNIFSFTVYISIALMLLFAVISYPIAYFYNNNVYVSLGRILSIALLFSALNMVPNGILNREKKFGSIAIRTVVVYLGSAVITLILAYLGFRYYALAIQAVLASLLTFIWNCITTKPKFKLKFQFISIKKVLNYSGFQFAFNMVNYFSRNLDNLLTGKFMGSSALGYYNKAYSLMLYPVNNLAGVISPVLHPLLSDYQDRKEYIYSKYTKIVRILACVGIYITAVCFLGAPEIIRILFGSKWSQSVECFKLLSIAIVPQMINSSSGGIFQAIGNTKLLFINSCINSAVTVIAILCGVFIGNSIVSLSAWVAIAYVVHFITATYMLIKLGFKYKLMEFLKELLPEVILIVGMVVGILVYNFTIKSIFLSLVCKCAFLGVIYIVLLFLTKEHKIFKSLLKR